MAAIPVVISGITGEGEPITISGMMAYSDRGVGGGPGPDYPAHPIAPGGKPPGIWPGGTPEHPIVLPPGKPDVPPPSIWPGGTPEHPIVLPDPGNPIPPGTLVTWKAVWSEDAGWMVVGVPNVPHPAPA